MIGQLDISLKQNNWYDTVFELDLMLWGKLRSLLRKQPQYAMLKFGLEPEVVEVLRNNLSAPKHLSSGVLISFKLDYNSPVLLRNLSGVGNGMPLTERRFSNLDLMYWFSLQKLAMLDIEKTIVVFSIPRKIAEWVTSASYAELHTIAVGTTKSITLRYSNRMIQEILAKNYNSALFFKKMMFGLQVNKGG